MVYGPFVRIVLPALHSHQYELPVISKPRVRWLCCHRLYAGQAIGGQGYRPIGPLRRSPEIEPKPLARFILGELAVEAPSPQMGGVARAPVERGDASDAFALELIVGIFYIGRHPFARRAGERRPIVRKDADALEIAFRIAAANQDTELRSEERRVGKEGDSTWRSRG